MDLGISHVLYGLFTLVIILTMVFRKGVVLPTLLGTFVVAWVYKGSIVSGFTAVFNANLVAAKELFNIFLIITFMVALLHALKDLGADRRMISPIQKFMTNGHVSYFILVVATYVISLFFWPTPAVPLICALLVPAAIRAGLPVMVAAVAIALAGQGMALSSDYVIQVAPELSAKAAGIETSLVADQSLILSLVTGIVAIGLVYFFSRKSFRKKSHPQIEVEIQAMQGLKKSDREAETSNLATWSKVFAVLVPVAMIGVMCYMVFSKLSSGRMGGFEGGDGAAFIGGVAVILLLLASVAFGKHKALDHISDHITEGFVFAFRAMGPVIPIAGFFFLGSSDFAGNILSIGENAPAFLFDLVEASQTVLPDSSILLAFSILIIGIITGLDGSGFSGLPLTGSLAGALSTQGIDASTLASIGQMGSIWTGGGTIVAWSSVIAIAGFCGISVMELVRKTFLPVMIGLVTATIFAILIF
jgi:hypothetical protein